MVEIVDPEVAAVKIKNKIAESEKLLYCSKELMIRQQKDTKIIEKEELKKIQDPKIMRLFMDIAAEVQLTEEVNEILNYVNELKNS